MCEKIISVLTFCASPLALDRFEVYGGHGVDQFHGTGVH